ncbi:Holliday junction branch migration protein RuvA [Roseisolibacter sp. H3M3-2]|uniref:Holliday junction branch migration protein RuvA n=1 Tax=Roseisolibacter sp. H3M3-2 TaxID=3031323 RepID=UPI0023DB58D0|nr:Holliday junction branch migration protein RuvA [Roseisolibacter sp. H3M3-2]MDF1503089.1 Holliday junction branch migration protein RuvA [Roseisolibacter sp. H3M3-2]
MIAHVVGRVVAKELDRVELLTKGGVGFELFIPLSTYEGLPKLGEDAALHTHLVVKEDGWQLFGFASAFERRVFQRVLGAKGVGPALAIGMLSTLTAERLVRAIREKDVATLQGVPRVGRKKAEQLILDLADKLDELQTDPTPGPRPDGASADDAIRALVSLGYTTADAERAVKGAIDAGGKKLSATELIRASLARIGAR